MALLAWRERFRAIFGPRRPFVARRMPSSRGRGRLAGIASGPIGRAHVGRPPGSLRQARGAIVMRFVAALLASAALFAVAVTSNAPSDPSDKPHDVPQRVGQSPGNLRPGDRNAGLAVQGVSPFGGDAERVPADRGARDAPPLGDADVPGHGQRRHAPHVRGNGSVRPPIRLRAGPPRTTTDRRPMTGDPAGRRRESAAHPSSCPSRADRRSSWLLRSASRSCGLAPPAMCE